VQLRRIPFASIAVECVRHGLDKGIAVGECREVSQSCRREDIACGLLQVVGYLVEREELLTPERRTQVERPLGSHSHPKDRIGGLGAHAALLEIASGLPKGRSLPVVIASSFAAASSAASSKRVETDSANEMPKPLCVSRAK